MGAGRAKEGGFVRGRRWMKEASTPREMAERVRPFQHVSDADDLLRWDETGIKLGCVQTKAGYHFTGADSRQKLH